MSESLRDQLEKAYDSATETPAETPAPVETPVETAPVETAEQKAGRTAGRERDEKGRLLPGPAKKPEAPAVTVAAPEPHPERPSSWKKDYWDHWGKLDPSVAKYIRQREDEYAKGVSTYKNEFDRAKPFLDAYAPYQADFERHGIDPAKQFAKYVEIHRTFAQGTPQQKLQTFLQLAQDYQVPVNDLFVQGQDGRLYFNQQVMQQAQQAASQPQQPDVKKLVQEAMSEQQMQQQIQAMSADTKKYPHFKVLREEMAGLLQAGSAKDLDSAYQKALRLNDELFAKEQEAKRKADEAERQEAQRKAVAAARQNQVSPKSATPAASVPGGGKKGLRSTLEEAFDQHASGRV